ncbi:chorion peroxidase-like isoform X1 [Portunus trituberculatus]|uniref:chorion peroxidase-like isoform X1 n=2 Tax=Portunus trituberculatus TaxID=210409 RepID=UPI001E1D215B|nr:chorion peroxidase-like isoform X1 [Portunus trituberculatus]
MAGRVSAMWGAGVCLFMVATWGRTAGQLSHCPNGTSATPPESTTSPYWGDPEGRRPNTIPNMTSTNLHAPPRECSAFLQPCDPSDRYRTLTGHCNNLRHYVLGAADTPVARLLHPVYDEALMRTRGVDGCLLPNPRNVSLHIRHVPAKYQRLFSTLFMQIGQFIDHDIIHTMTVESAVKSRECGDCEAWTNPICLPIPIPPDDPFIPPTYAETGKRRCLPVVRSLGRWLPDRRNHNAFRHINLNTAFLDLSTVYGSDPCREKELRTRTGGLLRESHHALPPLVNASRFVECRTEMGQCFLTGDDRANEHLGLVVLHVVYFREHNRIARSLASINPHWNDERIFQEARKINIAQYQKMVYHEFLPLLLGRQRAKQMGFNNQTEGYYEGYDANTDPSLMEEFTSAAFRVGHAMIPNHLLLVGKNYRPFTAMPLVPTFHNPGDIMQDGMYDQVLRGMIRARLEVIDLKLTDAILNHLFQLPDDPFSGQDLMALNIARGRDHAIAPYVEYLNMCEGLNVTTFEELEERMKPEPLRNIRDVYRDVRDVDLIVGSLAESTSSKVKTMVGPTMRCIIGLQFLYLKRGDRFWFENRIAGFTPEQLTSLRQSSLSRVVCDSLNGTDATAPRKALKMSSRTNRARKCSDLTGTDLELWREEPGSQPHNPSACQKDLVFKWQEGWVEEGCT